METIETIETMETEKTNQKPVSKKQTKPLMINGKTFNEYHKEYKRRLNEKRFEKGEIGYLRFKRQPPVPTRPKSTEPEEQKEPLIEEQPSVKNN